jgi:hypothetical protein
LRKRLQWFQRDAARGVQKPEKKPLRLREFYDFAAKKDEIGSYCLVISIRLMVFISLRLRAALNGASSVSRTDPIDLSESKTQEKYTPCHGPKARRQNRKPIL